MQINSFILSNGLLFSCFVSVAYLFNSVNVLLFVQIRNCSDGSCISWSQWGAYSLCSVTCGSGEETRTRMCLPEGTPLTECDGDPTESRTCTLEECGRWGSWTFQEECSVTCGDGTRRRRRQCIGKKCVLSAKCSPNWREIFMRATFLIYVRFQLGRQNKLHNFVASLFCNSSAT